MAAHRAHFTFPPFEYFNRLADGFLFTKVFYCIYIFLKFSSFKKHGNIVILVPLL